MANRTPESYDFSAPRRLAQVQMRVLAGVHESFSQSLALALSTRLRSLVDVEVESVAFVPYAEYVAASPSPAALFVSREETGHHIALDIDPAMAVLFVERLLGGEANQRPAIRELSAVERHVMKRLVEGGLRQLERAWARAAPLSINESRFESEAEFCQLAAGTDRVAMCQFTIFAQDQEGSMAVVYPLRLLERLLDRPSLQRWNTGAETRPSPALRAGYEETVRGLPVEVHAELGRARLPLADLNGLAVGDVIPLQADSHAPISVFVCNRRKFIATPGATGDRLAFRILHVLQPTADEDDDPHSDDA